MYIIYVSRFTVIHLKIDTKIKCWNECCIETEGVVFICLP